jgi:hypothetical protein
VNVRAVARLASGEAGTAQRAARERTRFGVAVDDDDDDDDDDRSRSQPVIRSNRVGRETPSPPHSPRCGSSLQVVTDDPALAVSFSRALELLRSVHVWRDALPAVVVFAALVFTGFENGGFFPGAWTTTAVAFLWVAALALLLDARLELGVFELAWLAGLSAITAWTALSATWSLNRAESVLEVRRDLVYLAAASCVLVLARRGSVRPVVTAVWGAVSVVVAYALARYLFGSKAHPDLFQANLLFRPLGYANGFAIFAGLAMILAIALAAQAPSRLIRTLAAVSVAPFAAVLELTSSRAGALAVAFGLATMLVLDRRRAQLLQALLVVGPAAAIVVALCRQSRVAEPTSIGAAAEHRAHLLALGIALVAGALAFSPPAFAAAGRVLAHLSRLWSRRASVLIIAAGAALAIYAGSVWADRFSNSGYRTAYWDVAWRQYIDHPWLGAGAGTFADYWVRYGDQTFQAGALDAHNLYLERLAELGPLGLALVSGTLALPLVAAAAARRAAFVPAATGAYVALLVHSALDWDWELPAVTLAGLACAAAVLIANRAERRPRHLSTSDRGVALAVILALALFVLAAQAAGFGGTYG